MKKGLLSILLIVCVLLLTACGGEKETEEQKLCKQLRPLMNSYNNDKDYNKLLTEAEKICEGHSDNKVCQGSIFMDFGSTEDKDQKYLDAQVSSLDLYCQLAEEGKLDDYK